jgi:uncharacterized membrane protein YczE
MGQDFGKSSSNELVVGIFKEENLSIGWTIMILFQYFLLSNNNLLTNISEV